MYILGFDIGGANTKSALIQGKNNELFTLNSYIEFFPFWQNSLKEIPLMLSRVYQRLIQGTTLSLEDIDYIAITITAELSDAFQTKREGILTILDALEQVFDKNKLLFISSDATFVDYDIAIMDHLKVSGANWASTALFLGKFISNCVLIDAGSTTVDIIPILNSKPITVGKTDVERMLNHELIYTGGLRATIPSITHFVPYQGKKIRISFEKFALISDIHRILDNITEKEYLNDTADGRTRSMEDCYARLSRIICMDKNMITFEELKNIAQYIYDQQLLIIKSEISQFIDNLIIREPSFKETIDFVITGLSSEFLIRKSLEGLGHKHILDYKEITKISDNISSSALAVAGSLYFYLIN